MTSPPSQSEVDLAPLRDALGDSLRTDRAVLDEVRADKSGHVSRTLPLAVVEATSVEQVQTTLRFATEHRIPVVPRGAGTGVAGGAIGSAGEIVLSTRSMDRILEVSVDDELAVVEAGVLNGTLNTHLADHGLWFAPDPASRAISTVGGNIATNAGGLLCAKYGVTRESVLGLRVVLADGRLLRLGRRTVKGVSGYDLTALVVGSEGTLAVIVEATVRVRPIPRGLPMTLTARFGSVEQAARASSLVTASGLTPAILELLDPRAIDRIAAFLGIDLRPGAYLIAQTDGAGAAEEGAAIAAAMRSLGGDVESTLDPVEGERLFAIRRAFHPSLEQHGNVLVEDVAVPRSALAAMFSAIERIREKYGVEVATVAHAGDGNLHPNFIFEAETVDGHLEVPDEIWAAADEMFVECLRLGGTLTGGHGVGILKKRWLRDELGDDSFDLHRRIKDVFDPLGILNPGKIL